MNRKQYLKDLEEALYGLESHEIKDILYDIDEHFSSAVESGKSEEEIIKTLGSPTRLADQYLGGKTTRKKQSVNNPSTPGKAVLVTLALLFFNLVFVLGFYIGLWGILIGFFGVAIGFLATGIGLIIFTLVPFSLSWISIPFVLASGIAQLAFLLLGIGFLALGILMFIGLAFAVKYLVLGTGWYVRANLKLIAQAGGRNEY